MRYIEHLKEMIKEQVIFNDVVRSVEAVSHMHDFPIHFLFLSAVLSLFENFLSTGRRCKIKKVQN
jgi:hypothetical protein